MRFGHSLSGKGEKFGLLKTTIKEKKGFELEGYFLVFKAINSKSEIEETSIFGPPFIPLWIALE